MTKRVLVVDDEEDIRSFIAEALEGPGLHVVKARDGQEAAELCAHQEFHLVITDLTMPRLDGLSLLRKLRAETPETEVILLTAHGTVGTAVEAMKLGAFDYLQKPLSGPDELRLLVRRALEMGDLRAESDRHKRTERKPPALVATDPLMLAVAEQIRKVAATNATVLLLGESGTGKEVAARAVHSESPRSAGPFVAVNCAAITETLLESEIFGHEKGAFTGATEARRGRFELADGGTLFLDEVGELAPGLQSKLLRVLEERKFERVGGSRTVSVDVRLVAATNRDLAVEMQAGRFRADLYHRLAVFPIRMPPLRERKKDVIPLAEHLLLRIGEDLGRRGLSLSKSAQAALLARDWPGNVRELRNVLERAAILTDGKQLEAEHLGAFVAAAPAVVAAPAGSAATLKDAERAAIAAALAATGGHRKQAAERLGIGERTLYDKIKEYGL
ncbi:MAG TPA: sigma-54 dependent transcriptional regulator [Myxococcales bacterium]|nr:sigma-54 dependent transcriptional regulator [Myxococcales bacterium]